MNSGGPPGLISAAGFSNQDFISKGGQVINLGRAGGISIGRHSLPGTTGGHGGGGMVLAIGGGNKGPANIPVKRPAPPQPAGKLMRLRCRFRPLHDAYIKNGTIVDNDADVIFLCGDGHQVKAHKVIMASSSKFFAKVFEDQTNQVAIVSVPDIKVDVMKLILQLTYRDRVILTMRQIKEVGDFLIHFGMAWGQFGYEPYQGEEPMSALPLPPITPKPVEYLDAKPAVVVHAVSPTQPQQQTAQQSSRKVYSGPGARATLQQSSNNIANSILNATNGINEDEEENFAFQAGQQGTNQNVRHSRKSQLTPRAGTEGEDIVEQDEEDDPEHSTRDWMNKLGKRDSNPNSAAAVAGPGGPMKRMRVDDEQQQLDNSNPKPKNSCSVCQQQFKSETAWRWHEDRHVGHKMFICRFCEEINNTPKACWMHERDAHGFSGLVFANNSGSPQAKSQSTPNKVQPIRPQPTQRVLPRPNNPVVTTRFANPQQFARHLKINSMKKAQAAGQKKKPIPGIPGAKISEIGIGSSNGSEHLDSKKLKQLHWLYVCEKCENCADSASKAQAHFEICFPNKERKFEDTVTRYRQGFYGKSSCPLCPRQYPQNSGFMIHCGHQHQQYRKLFTHVGGADDSLKCNSCKEKFAKPAAFHEHLGTKGGDKFYCGTEPGDDSVQEPSTVAEKRSAPTTRSSAEGKVTRPRPPRRPESPMESKASYKVQFHTPPRSARLANRVQAEASAEAAKNKTTDINFPPVDCPVCGDSDLPNISVHLQSKHKDLNVDVTRISSELLRCKGCTITFDVCDLLDHKNCLSQQQEAGGGDDEESNSSVNTPGPSRRSSGAAPPPSTPTVKVSKAAPIVVDMDSLPPGVGRSPIEKIEISDLLSIQAIRSALKCLICGNTAKKLGVIADCLRTHGIHRCSLCFNSYCSKNDYGLHLRKCHGSGSNKLKCPLCPKAFANAGQTSGHMYSTHWLQILKQNEQALDDAEEKEESATKQQDDKSEKDKAIESTTAEDDSTTDGDAAGQEEGNVDEEGDKESANDDQAETSGVAPEQDDEVDSDDDKMEIDEDPQADKNNEDIDDKSKA